jgi:hypothetical protein
VPVRARREIQLRGRAGDPHYLLMTITAAVLSLTVAASPARVQQPCRRWGPISRQL